MVSFFDDFNRADVVSLNGVNGWSSFLGTWANVSNQLKLTTTHNTALLIQQGTPMATPDHYAEIKLGALIATFGPVCRLTGSNNFYMLRRASGTTVSLYKNVGGTTTTISTATRTLAVGDVMRIEAVGSTIKGYVNGVEVLSATDTSLPTGNLTGVRVTATATNMVWDDFRAADIGSQTADTTAPEVAITAPTASLSTTGTVTLSASASDNVGVALVTFFIDGTAVGSGALSGGVWSRTLDTTTLEDGGHTVTASAVDQAGNVRVSEPVEFSVDNAPEPVETESPIRFDSSDVVSIRVGDFVSDRIYLGNELVWGDSAPLKPEDGVPLRVASYGPNGTHWPTRTPWKGDTSVASVEVDCSWSAIALALANISKAEADAGIIVRVRPGSLSGNGGGATSVPVISNLGSKDWAKRVLVYPRDGYGSVTITNQVRYLSLYNITIAGLKFTDQTSGGWLASDCSMSAFAWTRQAYFGVYSIDGRGCHDVDLAEVVNPSQINRDSDIAGLRTADVANSPVRRVNMYGSYLAPAYKTAGSSSHCDTWQHSGQGGNAYEDFLMQDTMVGGSTNAAVQIGSANNWRGDHVLIVGGRDLCNRVWPIASGRATNGNHAAMNGEATNLQVKDSLLIGGMGAAIFTKVENSKISYAWGGTMASAFTLDTSLNELTQSQVFDMSPTPTDEYLASVWA